MTRKHARFYMLFLLVCGAAASTALVLTALSKNISYFRTPTELRSGDFPERINGRQIRLGGLVEKETLQRTGTTIFFRVTDFKNTIDVTYDGVVPDLFREGQGVIAEGRMTKSGNFQANRLLAKHDEKYMPPEVARELSNGKAPP